MRDIERTQELKVIYARCKRSFLFFVRYMFRELNGSKYIVAEHHIKIAEALEDVVRGKTRKLIINIAPRYGKTELVVKMFISWVLAFNQEAKFLHLSYSDTLALDNSEAIKDLVESAPFKELFGEFELKADSKSKKKWYTSKGGGVYATATGGQVTGFGSGKMEVLPDMRDKSEEERRRLFKEMFPGTDYIPWVDILPLSEDIGLPEEDFEDFGGRETSANQWVEDFFGATIIDDPNKPEDAGSNVALEKVTTRFESTIRHRVNDRKTPIIVIGQRIDPRDLCGHLIDIEPDDWTVLSLPCLKPDGTALWPRKHMVEELKKIEKADKIVYENQYQQNPRPRKGLMYRDFETYKTAPTFKAIRAQVDTADTGKDKLCSIVFGIPEDREDKHGYLLDVIYTPLPMEKTEHMVAQQLDRNDVSRADIESNNGGRGFARKVGELKKGGTYIRWYHEGRNKDARIYSNSGSVNEFFRMPENWASIWPEFYEAITRYKKEGGNEFDDAPDCLTAGYERSQFRQLV